MIGGRESVYSLHRRTVLGCVLSGVSPTIAGCGDSIGKRRPSGKTSTDSVNSPKDDEQEAVDEILEEIQEIYDHIRQFPIVREREFVFEVRAVEDEFDYRGLLDRVDSAKSRIEGLGLEDGSAPQKPDLVLATEVAENMIRQRIVVHQMIAAGITFEESFGRSEYDRAIEGIRDGISILNTLSANRKEIVTQVTQRVTEISSIEAYDPESIRETQVVLEEILHWTHPAYRGLFETAQGLQAFEEGNSALNTEKFGSAGNAYQEAEDRFRSAEEAFDRAHGRGRQLRQIAPFVDGVRCMLPAYQTSSDELRRSMVEFEAGNDSKAREIGREAIISTNRITQRCI